MTPQTNLTLCADDYGLAPGLGVAIREMIDADRLTATSCMTGSPYWTTEAALLRPLADKADLGLHITLTDHMPVCSLPRLAPSGRFPSAGQLFKLAISHQLKLGEITAEIESQLEAFISEMGQLPDFLDGHHHVHQLPIVREAVLDIWRRRLSDNGVWVRSCCEPFQAVIKRRIAVPKALFLGLSGVPLKRALRAEGIPHNANFLGIYDLNQESSFGFIFKCFMEEMKTNALFMCHPGLVDAPLRAADSLTDQREKEFRYFMSDDFLRVLDTKGLVLTRLSQGQRVNQKP